MLLAVTLRTQGIETLGLLGAQHRYRLLSVDDLETIGVSVHIATDDGSVGHHGFITEILTDILTKNDLNRPIIYACGPHGMLAAVSQITSELGVQTQVAMENRMGCALGVCLGCVCPVRIGENQIEYQRVCTEGPVFNALKSHGKYSLNTETDKIKSNFYQQLIETSLRGELLSDCRCEKILSASEVELLPLLDAAYQVRKTYYQNTVQLHILNNAQNGMCPEDCYYCVQAKTATTDIDTYSLKPMSEILAEAERAYHSGAYRYCIVMSGRGPNLKRVKQLTQIIQTVKAHFPIEVCLSVGLIDEPAARTLKEAGLDRLNHNLNTSESHYPNICSTHTYQDRMETLHAAQAVGLSCCSGVIVGMGEDNKDLISVAKELRRLGVASIPVNFFLPIAGTQVQDAQSLTPDFCLRVLCLYRFLNPTAEVRVAAGREHHLRGMEVMSLYPANSMFLDGYLNAKGKEASRTLQMIEDAGFTIETNISEHLQHPQNEQVDVPLKDLTVLRPRIGINS